MIDGHRTDNRLQVLMHVSFKLLAGNVGAALACATPSAVRSGKGRRASATQLSYAAIPHLRERGEGIVPSHCAR